MKTESTRIEPTPSLVVIGGGGNQCNFIQVAWPDPISEVSPFLAQGGCQGGLQKIPEMLWDVLREALVGRPCEQPVPGHLD